ncbi:hypothetical protein FOL47_005189 [Perkinsus chesapeaki]|uniref:Uncharacterized protein n=1 Tax=Perkinsus chesapeaki TaxID=330153 RepID=A0A7J6LYL6_PERCH|nr:hypothetical protein FOL47_005189 [Perkinsus chesapeaki]
MVVFGDENKGRRKGAELLLSRDATTISCSIEAKNESLKRNWKPPGKIPIITQSDFNSLMATGAFHEDQTRLRAVVEAVSNAPKRKGVTGKRSPPVSKGRGKPEIRGVGRNSKDIVSKTQTRKAPAPVREARPAPQSKVKAVATSRAAPKKASPAKRSAPTLKAAGARRSPPKEKEAPAKETQGQEPRITENRTPTRESVKEGPGKVVAVGEDTGEVDNTLSEANKQIDMKTFYLGGTCETEEEANERERLKQQRYRDELEAQLAERLAESGKRRMSCSRSTQAHTTDGSNGGAALSSDSPCSMTSFGVHSSDEQREEKEKQARLRAILDQQIAEQTEIRIRLEAEKRAREEADEERVRRELVEIAAMETHHHQPTQRSIEQQPSSQGHLTAGSPCPVEQVAVRSPPRHEANSPPTTRSPDASAHPRTASSQAVPTAARVPLQQSSQRLGVVYAPAYLVTQTPHGATVRPISQSLAVPVLRSIPQLNLPARPYVTRSLDRVNTQMQYFAGNLNSLCGQFGQKPTAVERSLRGTTRLVESPSPSAKRGYVVPRSGRADSPIVDSLSSSVVVDNNNKEMQFFLRENVGKAPGRWGGGQPKADDDTSSPEGSDDASRADTARGGLITERSMANISKFISTDSMMDTWTSDKRPNSSQQSSLNDTPRLETPPPELEEPPIREEASVIEAVEDDSDECLNLENSPVQEEESTEELDADLLDESRQSSHCSFIDGPSISLADSLSFLMMDERWSSCHYTAFIATVLQTEELKCRHEIAETLSVLRDRAIIIEQISSSSGDDCSSDYSSESSFLQQLSDDTGLAAIFEDEESDNDDLPAGPFLKLSGSPEESGSIGGSPLVTERHAAASFTEEAAGTGGWSESSGTLE